MASISTYDERRPDPAAFWRWVWASVRPVLGYILVAFGLLLLLIAYFGVSREVIVARQIPYLVSGGLFGIAAVTLGSRLLLIEDLRRDAGRLDRLEQAVAELHAALLTRADAPDLTGDHGAHLDAYPDGNGYTDRLLALPNGESFHRPDCPIVVGKAKTKVLTPAAAQSSGLQACRMCQPQVGGV